MSTHVPGFQSFFFFFFHHFVLAKLATSSIRGEVASCTSIDKEVEFENILGMFPCMRIQGLSPGFRDSGSPK